jgi:hypothetical protein
MTKKAERRRLSVVSPPLEADQSPRGRDRRLAD